jgi:hypothetical protein
MDGPAWQERESFAGADLRQATFDQHHFKMCDLSRADLRGASLRGASFAFCDLRGADLRDADLTYASSVACSRMTRWPVAQTSQAPGLTARICVK